MVRTNVMEDVAFLPLLLFIFSYVFAKERRKKKWCKNTDIFIADVFCKLNIRRRRRGLLCPRNEATVISRMNLPK